MARLASRPNPCLHRAARIVKEVNSILNGFTSFFQETLVTLRRALPQNKNMFTAGFRNSFNPGPIVLVVDDDPNARQLVRRVLGHDYSLIEAQSVAEVFFQIEVIRPLLVLTELDLPGMNGMNMIRQLRARKFAGQIVGVSARSREKALVEALDSGADDFVPKPYSLSELKARIRLAFRRSADTSNASSQHTFQAGELEVDFDRRCVTVSGKEVHLTPKEYKILSVLIVNADRVLTYKHLLHEIWKSPKARHITHLRVYIASLRKKLGSPRTKLNHLVTKSGVGYQFYSGGR